MLVQEIGAEIKVKGTFLSILWKSKRGFFYQRRKLKMTSGSEKKQLCQELKGEKSRLKFLTCL